MSVNKISEAILGVGVDDTTIDLFESQYPVPTGVSYNFCWAFLATMRSSFFKKDSLPS